MFPRINKDYTKCAAALTPEMRKIEDVDTLKNWIDSNITEAFTNKVYAGKKVTLSMNNVKITPREYTLADQKKAIMSGRSLSRPVKANLKLTDNETGKTLDTRANVTVAMAPYHTGRNTVISNGVYYVPTNQVRLRAGAYTRKKANNEIETHFNLESGTGSGMRININPATGIFGLKLGTSNIKLYPLLREMGVKDEVLKDIWGAKTLRINQEKSGGAKDIVKIYQKLHPYGNPSLAQEDKIKAIVETLGEASMEPSINEITLGATHKNVTKEALIDATKKIMKVSKGEDTIDDRDSLQFKKIYGVEDFYKEKIMKDAGKIGKSLVVHKFDRSPDLEKFPPSYFTRQLWGVIKGDSVISPKGTLAQPLEEITPLDVYDQHHKVTTMGEGGISDSHVISLEARNVHPSQFGFVDHIRTPESINVGIDQRLALNTRKGKDNLIYAKFIDAKTGKVKWIDPLAASKKIIAFPGFDESRSPKVDAMDRGVMKRVPRGKVEYYIKHPNELYSTYNNLVPMPQSVQGNRMVLAGKGLSTAMPIVAPEAPLVRTYNPLTGNSFEKDYGHKILAKTSKVDGVVHSISKNNIYVKDNHGKLHRHGLYNNFPLNLKTMLTNKIKTHRGTKVKKGDVLASSNFTDKEGVLANGKNLRSAYMPYRGWNFEDGIVISEGAAKKLTSEQVYTYELKLDPKKDQTINTEKYRSIYPDLVNEEQSKLLDEDGVVKKGAKLNPGDPIILSMEKRTPSTKDIQLGNLHNSLKNSFTDTASTWGHHSQGEVLDVYKDKNYAKVIVKTDTPATVGDKLTGRYGNKGVIGAVIPTGKMPYVKDTGEKLEIILNPLGIPSRINPGQVHEAMLGKIAAKTGKLYRMQSFKHTNLKKFVDSELKKNRVKADNDIVLPDSGRTLKKVINGVSYILKLSKLSEGEIKKRDVAGYDINEQPIKGKSEGGQAMRIGSMEANALRGHGALHNLREMSAIKGQANHEFWRELKLGKPIPTPGVPFVYKKFITMLEGAGINVKKDGEFIQLLPGTDRETLRKSKGEITSPDLLYTKNFMPVKKGLFDPSITGGTVGENWSHIKLAEPLPHPVMEEPIKKLLGINKKEFNEHLRNNTLYKALKNVSLEGELDNTRRELKAANAGVRDKAIKKLGYLSNLKENGYNATDLMLRNVPVIPPIYRPVSVVGTKGGVSPGGANLLYKDMLMTDEALRTLKKEVSDDALGNERENNYKALKAVVGLGDPINIKNKNKRVKGFLADIVGDQPKTGFFQRRVVSKTQDLVGRGVASPDPTLNINQIGLPEDIAWKMYQPFIMRKLVNGRVDPLEADELINKRTPQARAFLKEEMSMRPVIMNRNPSLHKYNIMAFNPKLHKGNTIMVSPSIVNGYNLDYDGDQINMYIPVMPEAVREAEQKMMPSKNLLHIGNRKVHYTPTQESLYGAYSLTKPPKDKRVKGKYKSINEVRKALANEEISANDMVEVKNL